MTTQPPPSPADPVAATGGSSADPIHDELSPQAKEALARTFAALRAHYSSGHYLSWRVHERLRNSATARRFDEENHGW